MTETMLIVAAIAFAASILFGFSNHVQHVALDHMNVRDGTIVNVGVTAVMLWLIAPFFFKPAYLMTPSIGWFVLAGLIVPSLSMTFHTMSVRTVGPALTAGLASTSPVFAMVLAVIFLGELVTSNILVGTAIVVGGIAFVALRARGGAVSWPMWAIALPLGAALTRAIAHNVIKFGLTDLPSPLTAALVSSTVSFAGLLAYSASTGHKLPLVRTSEGWNRGYLWFSICGILNGVGLIGLIVALDMGQVVVVAPLIATTPAFTLIVGWLFFQREVVAWQTIVAIAAIFCGCMMILLR